MPKIIVTLFSVIVLFGVATPTTSFALTCGSWKDAEKSIRSWWIKAYPNEKILTIAQNGPAQTYSKVKSTNQKKIDEYGNEWEYFQKNPYCSIPAKLKVQQSSGPRIFNVSAIFKVSGKKFTFDDVATGGSEAVAEPGQAAAPDKDEIKRLLTEAYMSNIPPDLQSNIKVDKIMISPRQLQRWEGGQTAYSMTGMDLYLVIDGQQKDKCEINMINLYKGEVKNKRLEAGGPWKIEFVLKNDLARCADKYENRVSDFVNHVEVKAPPAVDTSWMKNIVGVYKGDIQGEVYNPVTTVLTVDSAGKLSGTYEYTEHSKHISGTISDCTAPKVGWARCKLQDQENSGQLQFQFKKDLTSFTGKWWTEVEHRSNQWDGKKTSETVPTPKSSAKASDAAPASGLNNVLKGFGF